MLDLIYIVEERYASFPSENADASYRPNFTIPGQDKPVLVKKSAYSGAAIAAASITTSVLASILPLSLVAGAVTAAAGAAGIAAAKDRSTSWLSSD